jgi:spoIIIJ-associated protein
MTMNETSKSIELQGKTVEEAVQQALAQLGVGHEQVEVVVLEEQKGGLFGLLSQPSATVRVTVKEEVTHGEGGEREEREKEVSPSRPAPTAEEACALVQDILNQMQVEATATLLNLTDASESHARQAVIDLLGDDSGILIGKYGQTLYALQYLVNIILNKGNPNPLKVLLDVQGYRQRREESLKSVARNAAGRAVRQGRRVKLEPLPVHERRIIHHTLQDDKSVMTYSEGEEPYRYVIIAPTEENVRSSEYRGRERSERGGRGGYGRGGGGRPAPRPYTPRDTREWDDAWAQFEKESKGEEKNEQ